MADFTNDHADVWQLRGGCVLHVGWSEPVKSFSGTIQAALQPERVA